MKFGPGKSIGIPSEKTTLASNDSVISAINNSAAIIRFTPEGVVKFANENFLTVVGYSLREIEGQHHRMFVEPAFAASAEYRSFWECLRKGECVQGQFKRLAKGGREVWLQASYNPVFGEDGQLAEVIKLAADVTEQKLEHAELEGMVNALKRVQGVITFALDGTIQDANPVFLSAMGYRLDEIRGHHHSMFVESGTERTPEYQKFWETLRSGQFVEDTFKRIGQGGRVVWIRASYNPILDANGRPVKVVKLLTDISALIEAQNTAALGAESVSAATAELSTSIGDIQQRMSAAQSAMNEIVGSATQSESASKNLLASMKTMAQVTELIRSIAGRVNILALNASIEAARAGEAGRGFAVVATEVKNLASQTAQATDTIVAELHKVDTISIEVAAGVERTLTGVQNVNESVQGVTIAIDGQTAATREIAAHSARTADALGQIVAAASR